MYKTKRTVLRHVVICLFVIGLCTGVVFQTNDAYARVSLAELLARIEALEAENAGQQEQVDNNRLPVGTIIMWSGTVDAYGNPERDGITDTNWHICDGSVGTPDLRGRFVVGTGGYVDVGYSVGESAGNDVITITEGRTPEHLHLISMYEAYAQYARTKRNHDDIGQWACEVASGRSSQRPGRGFDLGSSVVKAIASIDLVSEWDVKAISNVPGFRQLGSGSERPSGSGSRIDIRPREHVLTFIMKVAP